MSKHDARIEAVGEASLEPESLRAALGAMAVAATGRHAAMARFLSGDDGWKDARRTLRGAFAEAAPRPAGLTGKKDK